MHENAKNRAGDHLAGKERNGRTSKMSVYSTSAGPVIDVGGLMVSWSPMLHMWAHDTP